MNKALLDRPDSHGTGFVTMVYGHITPADGGGLDIALVRAGHLPPLRLKPAESLLLYTDGITEARNTEHEQLGEERLTQALRQELGETPTAQQVIDAVTAAVHAFAGDAGLGDDQAALVLTAGRKEQG